MRNITRLLLNRPFISNLATMSLRKFENPALFVCDIQERFRTAIHGYDHVVNTTQKMLKAASILKIPIFATTQLRDKLGNTEPLLQLDSTETDPLYKSKAHADKSIFSMWIPEIQNSVKDEYGSDKKIQVVIVGIESHICVTQTTLDLLRDGHQVYVLADGISSCNPEEVPIALSRLRNAGAIVTTSESWIYECMGDASITEFKDIAKLVKESKDSTRNALANLCKSSI